MEVPEHIKAHLRQSGFRESWTIGGIIFFRGNSTNDYISIRYLENERYWRVGVRIRNNITHGTFSTIDGLQVAVSYFISNINSGDVVSNEELPAFYNME